MNIEFMYVALLFFSTASVIYGVFAFVGKKAPLFNQLVFYGIGCMMLGWLYTCVIMLTSGLDGGFGLSILGSLGGFAFLISASFGQMDGLVDDHSKALVKYRLFALMAPVIILIAYIIVLLQVDVKKNALLQLPVVLAICIASYYQLKHIVIPDVDFGILKSIRNYNRIALVFSVLSAAQILTQICHQLLAWRIISGILCVCGAAILPILREESKKWTI